MTNPFAPKSTFTFAEVQESIENIVNAFTDAVDEHLDDDEVKMRIAISFAANVFKRSMESVVKAQKQAEANQEQSIDEFLGGPFFTNGSGDLKGFFNGL